MEWEVNHKKSLVLVPDFRRASYERLGRHLEEVKWDSLRFGDDSQGTSVERTYNNIIKAIGQGQEQYISDRPIRKDDSG